MIRVLHFARFLNRHDVIDTVLTRLDRSRFEVHVLTCSAAGRNEPYRPDESYPTRCLNIPVTRQNYLKLLVALVREIRRVRPDVVHAHHYDESFLASLAVRLVRFPAFVITHHYSDHIYYLSRGMRRRFHLMIEAISNRPASRIIVPAREVFRILVERQHEPAQKVRVISNCLPFERIRVSSPDAPARLRREHGLDGKFVVLACGRVSREKGLEFLLQAVPALTARHPDVAVVIVGDGPYRPELTRLSDALGLDAVRFVGWRNDALDWLAAADVVVQPSLCESWCQVLIEAMALGRPVVMTPVGVAPEVIGSNERGRLVPLGDAGALSAALGELAADRELGRRLGEAGRTFVREHMRVDEIVREHEALYDEVVKQHAGSRQMKIAL